MIHDEIKEALRSIVLAQGHASQRGELRAGGRTEAELRWRERERTSRSTFTLTSFIVRW